MYKNYKYAWLICSSNKDQLQNAFDSCDSEFDEIIWIVDDGFLCFSNNESCSKIDWLANWVNINLFNIIKLGN